MSTTFLTSWNRQIDERLTIEDQVPARALAAKSAITMGHLALKRAIRHAEANDLVARNVATLADTPKGQEGPPSKSLAFGPGDRGHHCRGDSAGDGTAAGLKGVRPPAPPHRAVWRSVRAHAAAFDAGNVRKMFKRACDQAEIVYRRELRPVITTGAERSWTNSHKDLTPVPA